MKQFFITGTDTECGKTLVSAIFTLALNAYYWKPIQSGLIDAPADSATVAKLTGLDSKWFFPSEYALQASLSPEEASDQESIQIDLSRCVIPCRDPLIVEGAGGVYVPVNAEFLLIDLIKQLNLPVILVARGGLGTINHTLLTIEALKKYAIPIKGIVFSGHLNPRNQTMIEKWGAVKTLFHVPYFEALTPGNIQTWVHNNRRHIREILC